jgi:hypothetical protein
VLPYYAAVPLKLSAHLNWGGAIPAVIGGGQGRLLDVHCETVNLRQVLVSSGTVFVLLMEKMNDKKQCTFGTIHPCDIRLSILPRVVG